MSLQKLQGERLDRLGIFISSACAVHCLLMPLVLATASLGAIEHLHDARLELAVIGAALILASVSLWRGCRVHGRLGLWGLFALAAILLISSRFTHEIWIEAGLMVVGGLLIAACHWINLRLCRRCPACAV